PDINIVEDLPGSVSRAVVDDNDLAGDRQIDGDQPLDDRANRSNLVVNGYDDREQLSAILIVHASGFSVLGSCSLSRFGSPLSVPGSAFALEPRTPNSESNSNVNTNGEPRRYGLHLRLGVGVRFGGAGRYSSITLLTIATGCPGSRKLSVPSSRSTIS